MSVKKFAQFLRLCRPGLPTLEFRYRASHSHMKTPRPLGNDRMTEKQIRVSQLTGRALITLVAIVLILAGTLKLIGVGAEDMLEGLRKARLDQYKTAISYLAIACGLLLLMKQPFRRFGLLMSTAYWGGAIVAHLTYNDSILMPAFFLGLLWLGAWLSLQQESGPKKAPEEKIKKAGGQ